MFNGSAALHTNNQITPQKISRKPRITNTNLSLQLFSNVILKRLRSFESLPCSRWFQNRPSNPLHIIINMQIFYCGINMRIIWSFMCMIYACVLCVTKPHNHKFRTSFSDAYQRSNNNSRKKNAFTWTSSGVQSYSQTYISIDKMNKIGIKCKNWIWKRWIFHLLEYSQYIFYFEERTAVVMSILIASILKNVQKMHTLSSGSSCTNVS